MSTHNKRDLTGQIFSRLTVISEAGWTSYGRIKWLCRCECGNEIVTAGGLLTGGKTKSCGCYRKEFGQEVGLRKNHGMHGTPTWRSWRAMVKRCTCPTASDFDRYGGRGITVCFRWLNFNLFLKDMGPRPEGTSIDRFPDPNGNYAPGNCRWATPKEQIANRCDGSEATRKGWIARRAKNALNQTGAENVSAP
jgi:hypothetical protein